jgi:hypothetical protein
MMELDEFVDMDWLNSHSSTMDIKDETFDSSDPFYYMDSTFEPDFMNHDIVTDSALDSLDIQPTEEEVPPLEPSEEQPALLTTTTVATSEGKEETVKPALPSAFPSTEQIKLLIEAAKKQLALQQQQQLTSTTVPPSQTQIATMDNIVETMPITTVSPDKLTIKQEAEDQDAISETRSQTVEMASSTTSSSGRRNSKMDYDSDEEIHTPEDIKKMTPKERRQLRNKISARNFRVRRKGKENEETGIYLPGLVSGG